MSGTRKLKIISIVFFLYVTAAFAAETAVCLESYSRLLPPSLVEQLGASNESHWRSDSNIFTESLPSTLASSLAWMTSAQLIRHYLHFDPATEIFPYAFRLTLPIDMTLTMISHAISLSEAGWIRRAMDGKLFGNKYEFWARAGSNTAMGTAVIVSIWYATGVAVDAKSALAALGLCSGVYPVLQASKETLFKRLPLRSDVRLAARLEGEFPEPLRVLKQGARKRAAELGMDSALSDRLFISALEALVTSRPYENWVQRQPLLRDIPEIAAMAGRARALDEKMRISGVDLKAIREQMKNRRKLINYLLKLTETLRDGDAKLEAIQEVLSLGQPFTAQSSLKLQLALRDRAETHWQKILAASVLDQFLAVAIAGGVFLYSVNQYAVTGQTPWYIAIPYEWMEGVLESL